MQAVWVLTQFLGGFCLLNCLAAGNMQAIAQNTKPTLLPELDRFDSQVCDRPLEQAITAIVNRQELARSRWGIEVQTEAGKPLYSLNRDKFFTPASSLKLLTTAAALSTLGANYRLDTPVYTVGQPPDLTSLRIQGKGDPSISTQELKNIVHQLQTLGVKKIEQLIVDDSYFAPPAINPTWEWLDVHSYFATAVNSTILNQNSVTLTLLPQQIGEPVKYFWSDAIAARQWQVINRGVTVKPDIPYQIEIDGDLGKPSLQIRGRLASNEAADIWDLAIVDPAAYFLESLRLHLEQGGIRVNKGKTVEQTYSDRLETEIAVVKSTAIAEILNLINRDSNNLAAEALGKTLAKHLQLKNTTKAISNSLVELGLDRSKYVLSDASGLSRQNLATPKTLVTTLRLMLDSPNSSIYRNSLAQSGIRGTLKNRFSNSDLRGNVWGKTGTLTGVGTLSGYMIDAHRQTVFFSIVVNNSELSSQKIRQAIDEIVTLLYHSNRC